MITIVVGFVVAALLLALSGLIGDEVRGWLEFVPRCILRLVAMRLPADQRRAIYNEEWLPELIYHLREAEGRPITRLVVGIGYATSLARGAGRVARALNGVRAEEAEVRHIELHDVGVGVDQLHVYRDSKGGRWLTWSPPYDPSN